MSIKKLDHHAFSFILQLITNRYKLQKVLCLCLKFSSKIKEVEGISRIQFDSQLDTGWFLKISLLLEFPINVLEERKDKTLKCFLISAQPTLFDFHLSESKRKTKILDFDNFLDIPFSWFYPNLREGLGSIWKNRNCC